MTIADNLPESENLNPPFPELFLDYIESGVQEALERIDPDPNVPLGDEDRDRALHVLDYGLQLPKYWPSVSKLLLRLAQPMEQLGYRDNWITYLERGIQKSDAVRDTGSKGELCVQTGYLYFLRGKYEKARHYFEEGLSIYTQDNNLTGQGICQNRLAMVAIQQDTNREATARVKIALQLIEPEHLDYANCFYVLGEIARNGHSWAEAENHFRDALKIWETHHDYRRIAWGLRNLGTALRKQKKHVEAISVYEQALSLFDEIHDPVNRASAQMNLGNIFWEQGCFKRAFELYSEAKAVFIDTQDYTRMARVYTNIALCYYFLQKYAQAEDAFVRSVDLWKQLNRPTSLCNALEGLGTLYIAQNKYDKAQHIFKLAESHLNNIKDGQAKNSLKTKIRSGLKIANEPERKGQLLSGSFNETI